MMLLFSLVTKIIKSNKNKDKIIDKDVNQCYRANRKKENKTKNILSKKYQK